MTHRCLLWRCSETEDLLSDDSLPRSVPLCVCVFVCVVIQHQNGKALKKTKKNKHTYIYTSSPHRYHAYYS